MFFYYVVVPLTSNHRALEKVSLTYGHRALEKVPLTSGVVLFLCLKFDTTLSKIAERTIKRSLVFHY